MRFMDWESTNNSTLANFADRPNAAHFGQSKFGEPYEHIAELVNETGKDCWITVPELATDDFITQFAAFMAQNLDFGRIAAARKAAGFAAPFQLIVENSNETWNQSFSAYGTFLAAANANSARYTGTYTGSYGPSWMTSNRGPDEGRPVRGGPPREDRQRVPRGLRRQLRRRRAGALGLGARAGLQR